MFACIEHGNEPIICMTSLEITVMQPLTLFWFLIKQVVAALLLTLHTYDM